MRQSDLPKVFAIEQQAMTAPWTTTQLQEEVDAANGLALVAEEEENLRGYAFFRTCPPDCELLHVVVAPESRRRSVARSLLRGGFAAQRLLGCTDCYLEVRPSNTAARALYECLGFIQTGTRRQYYHQPDEDALLLSRRLCERSGE